MTSFNLNKSVFNLDWQQSLSGWLAIAYSGLAYLHVYIFLEPSLAFSHSPGCMFLTDIQEPSINPPSESTYLTTSCEFIPRSFLISHNPLLYSLASQRAVNKIQKIERIIGEDPGEMWNEQSKLAISKPSWVRSFQS